MSSSRLCGGLRPEEVAVLLHELIEVGLAAGHLLREHLVEVLDHLLQALHLLRRHVGDLLVTGP